MSSLESVRLPSRPSEVRALGSLPDPYPVFQALRARAPVHPVNQGRTVLVSRHADVRQVLRTPEIFSSSAQAGMEAVLAGADPPLHTRVRRSISRAFSPSEIGRAADSIRERCRGLIDAMLAAGGDPDLVAGYADPIALRSMRELLQIDASLDSRFAQWVHALAMHADASRPSPDRQEAERRVAELMGFLAHEHLPRCARPGQAGLVTDIATGNGLEGEPLPLDGKVGLLRLFLFAGIETVRALIGNCVLTGFRHPDVWQRLRAARELVPKMVEETIRFESPVQVIHRVALRDAELAGVGIPRGTFVLSLLGSANRDETQFAEPARFRIERADAAHIGFGVGIHFCLGSHLARLEARIALEELLARCPRMKPAEDLDGVRFVESFTTRGPERLRVSLA